MALETQQTSPLGWPTMEVLQEPTIAIAELAWSNDYEPSNFVP